MSTDNVAATRGTRAEPSGDTSHHGALTSTLSHPRLLDEAVSPFLRIGRSSRHAVCACPRSPRPRLLVGGPLTYAWTVLPQRRRHTSLLDLRLADPGLADFDNDDDRALDSLLSFGALSVRHAEHHAEEHLREFMTARKPTRKGRDSGDYRRGSVIVRVPADILAQAAGDLLPTSKCLSNAPTIVGVSRYPTDCGTNAYASPALEGGGGARGGARSSCPGNIISFDSARSSMRRGRASDTGSLNPRPACVGAARDSMRRGRASDTGSLNPHPAGVGAARDSMRRGRASDTGSVQTHRHDEFFRGCKGPIV